MPDDASVETGGDVPDDRRSSPQDERGDAQDGEGDALDDPGGTPPACPPPVLAGIEQTIGSQLDAFADDDVAGALGYASEAFRAQIDVASFERLIADAFPAVADPASFSIGGCHVEQASTQVLVGVVGADGGRMDLVYVMVEEAGRWAIDGARELATDRGMVA